MTAKNLDPLILQWNCRNLNANLEEFKQHLSEYNPEVICLQSPGGHLWDMPVLPGYYNPPYRVADDRGIVKVATYIKNHFTVTYETIEKEDNLYTVITTLETNSLEELLIINLYYPRSCKKSEFKWLEKVNKHKGPVVICGDFNAHHPLWDTGVDISGGTYLLDTIQNSPLIIANDGSITRVAEISHQQNTAPDITLFSADLQIDTTWNTHTDTLGSDHLPIHITLHNKIYPPTNDQEKYQYLKANWDKYQQILSTVKLPEIAHQDIDTYHQNLRKVIIEAADKSIPKVKASAAKNKGNPWWNEHCKNSVHLKRSALKEFKKNNTQENLDYLKLMKHNCSKVINEEKKKYWNDNIKTENLTEAWKTVKGHKSNFFPVSTPLTDGTKTTKSDLEKANLLADTFAGYSNDQDLLNKRQAEDDRIKQDIDNVKLEDQHVLNDIITVTDLGLAIHGIRKLKSATGTDPVSYYLLKNLPQNMKLILLDFYNHCFTLGSIPTGWNTATIIPLHKAGKPKKHPTSYRPVALTAHIGKLYERIIKNRLEWYLEKNNHLSIYQSGYRKKRGCTEQLVRLNSHLQRSLARNSKTLAAFYDIKRAFDTLWHNKLLIKIKNIGVTGKMFHMIKQHLANRFIQVKINNDYSITHQIVMGVPQGGVLAPILFNIILHDIEIANISRGFHFSVYADDIALWGPPAKQNLPYHLKRLQKESDKITNYLQLNGFELSATKTQFIIFGAAPRTDNLFLKVNNVDIPPVKEVKFLGVIFDYNLTWKAHIHHLQKKCYSAINLIKYVHSQKLVTDRKIKINLIRSLIRSKISYGQELFCSASGAYLNKLTAIECTILKYVLKLDRSYKNLQLYADVGWTPLSWDRLQRNANQVINLKSVHNSITNEITSTFIFSSQAYQEVQMKRRKTTAKRTIGIYNYTKDILETAKVNIKNLVVYHPSLIPPWLLETPYIDTEYDTIETKRSNPQIMATLAKEKITTTYKDHLKIYTDGSKHTGVQIASAFVIPSLNVTKSFKLNEQVSIFAAELYAILRALHFINDQPRDFLKIVILTDSKSSLQAILRRTKKRHELILELLWIHQQLLYKGIEVSLCWIPSHTGIRGNDLADAAASKSAVSNDPINNIMTAPDEAKSLVKKSILIAWKKQQDEELLNYWD